MDANPKITDPKERRMKTFKRKKSETHLQAPNS
uniref:Uncharacterized protein n=1 Tax=Nelumbo nucifera TaxID=4432 RepID=A0A822YTE9_NELNU|nr:TPA_asm: hypothetical protein HUJ06_005471 [Nelumbo nucifera]